MTDENLVQIGVDRSSTTVPASSWFYGVDPAGAGADFVISYENLTAEVERDIGTRYFQITPFFYTEPLTTGDGKAYFHVPPAINGWNLTYVHHFVITAGTTNTTDVQIANVTDAVDMLSTKLTIDSGETGSNTAATAAVIDTTKDDVATNDVLRIDYDQVSTTAPLGSVITLGFDPPAA